MDKYEELERLYYKKKYIKLFRNIIIFLVVIIISVLVYIQNKNTKHKIELKDKIEKVIKPEKNETQKHIKLKILKVNKKQKIDTHKINKPEIKKLTLYPIFPDITLLEQNKTKKTVQKPIEQNKTKPNITAKPIIKKQPEIKIIIKSQTEDLSNIITSYNISPNYAQAMQIANIYFKKKNYDKSILWSKKANKLNPEKSQSWYLFAKNLIELGKTKKAKKVLIVYLNTYGADEKIEQLLRSLK